MSKQPNREKLLTKLQIKRRTNHPQNRSPSVKFIIVLLFLSFMLSACASPYSKEEAIELISKISREKHGIEVELKQVNRTICILIPVKDFFEINKSGKLIFYGEKDKIINELFYAIKKILCNSNIDIDFFLIKLIGIDKGIELSSAGYINDYKKAYIAGGLSSGELLMRSILEPKIYSDDNLSRMKQFEEVKWPDFLIKQIRKRVLVKFSAKAELLGDYKEGEKFVFVLAAHKDDPKIIRYTWKTIARVMETYKFEDFETVSLIDLNSGKLIERDKGNLGN